MGFPSGSALKNPPAMQETQEMQVRSPDGGVSLEENMATHSSILAKRIPWAEKPGGLQTMGLNRAGSHTALAHTQRPYFQIGHIHTC